MSETVVLTEILSSNIDLGESLKWSTSWLNWFNHWWFKIKEDHNSGMELIFPILDDHGNLSRLVVWWRNTHQMWRAHELSIDCDTTEDTDWFSNVIELLTIDMYFSTTIGWSSKRSGLSNAWWVEENEFKTISNILVVQSQLHHNFSQWWCEGVLWTQASGLCWWDDLSWGLSKCSPQTESIIGIVNVIKEIERIEIVTFKSNLLFSSEWTKFRLKLLDCWVIVVPKFNVLLGVLLSIHGDWERHWLTSNIWCGWSAPKESICYIICLGRSRTEIASEIISKIKETISPDLNVCITISWSVSWIDVGYVTWFIISIWKGWVDIVEFTWEWHTHSNNFSFVVWVSRFAYDTGVIFGGQMFSFVESIWSLWASDVVCLDNLGISTKSTFGVWEKVNNIFKTFSSNVDIGTTGDWSTSGHNRLNNELLITFLKPFLQVFFLPFILNLWSQLWWGTNFWFWRITFSWTAIKIVIGGTLKDDIVLVIETFILCLSKGFKTSVFCVGRNLLGLYRSYGCQKHSDCQYHRTGQPAALEKVAMSSLTFLLFS